MIFELTKAIKHGEEVLTSIELREPTTKDIKVYGFPIAFETKDIKTDVIFKYVCALAALPPSVVDQICAKDFIGLTQEIALFFGGSGD